MSQRLPTIRKCNVALAWRLRLLQPVLQQCTLTSQGDHNRPLTTQTQAHIQVTPSVSLLDQKVQVRVQGLPAKAKVTLQLKTQQEWRKTPVDFLSLGHFVTSDAGVVDLDRDASVGGTYTGVEPMGLFWSMQPCPNGPQNVRLVVRNGDQPVLYTLSLYGGHWTLKHLADQQTTLTPEVCTTLTRLKKAADVRRIAVREGGVRGVLFLPPGEGPHPGVIDMFGSAGGLMETRAALLASRGFAVLALPFFRYQDLPASLQDVTFDYFEEAVSWLSGHRSVKNGGIGVVGVSTGAVFALVMAWKCAQVKAVVLMNGLPFVSLSNLCRKDGTLIKKGIPLDLSKASIVGDAVEIRQCFAHTTEDYIPAWESGAHLLVLTSDDDQQVDPASMAGLVSMYPQHKRHLVEVVHYPGAGHLLEPPFTPHCRACVNPSFGVDLLWGGNPVDHAAAQEDSWRRIVTFLHTHLS